MANSEHLKRLVGGLEAWRKFRADGLRGMPDLTGADLGSADLQSFDLSGANLLGANLRNAKLQGAQLRHATLNRSNLNRANLSGVNLSNSYLHYTDLNEANLVLVNLREADLVGTNFSSAKLVSADLSAARLTEVSFHQTQLSHANFDGVEMAYTIFADTDLSDARGLDTVNHRRPSTLGLDTLLNSKGKIPEVFLRGVGLPEVVITYLPSLIDRPIEFYSCFISYSHGDQSFARRLHDALQGRGIRCWLDEHQLLPGDKIYAEVDLGIRLWDKVLLCCSQASLKSWWVDNEIKIAFDKEQGLWKQRGTEVQALVPLNLDGYLFSGAWKSGMSTEVRSRLAADFTGWSTDNDKFENQFEKLLRALRTKRAGRERPPQSLL